MKRKLAPPTLLEKLGGYLLPQPEREFILGDLAELYAEAVGENGRFQQNLWYLNQLWRAVPPAVRLWAMRRLRRSVFMFHPTTKSDVQRFVVSVIVLIPAVLLIGTGLLHSLFGISAPMNNLFDFYNERAALGWMANPLVIMGGVFVAFVLSVRPLINLSTSPDEMRLRGSVTLIRGSLLTWLVIGVCLLMTLVIFLYLLAENFGAFA